MHAVAKEFQMTVKLNAIDAKLPDCSLSINSYSRRVRWNSWHRLVAAEVLNVCLCENIFPDYKSIAEFRCLHWEAVSEAGTDMIRSARSVVVVRGECIDIDGSKF